MKFGFQPRTCRKSIATWLRGYFSLHPPPALIEQTSALHICYHGTASHRDEIAWLVDVVRDVQSACQSSLFELFGGKEVEWLYRGIPRVAVVNPMSWPEYLAWSGGVKRDIALAPILANGFNAARGYTKFFDYVRLGAAGIYSRAAPYKGFIDDGVDGGVLENDQGVWRDAILAMLNSADKRATMAMNARRKTLRSA